MCVCICYLDSHFHLLNTSSHIFIVDYDSLENCHRVRNLLFLYDHFLLITNIRSNKNRNSLIKLDMTLCCNNKHELYIVLKSVPFGRAATRLTVTKFALYSFKLIRTDCITHHARFVVSMHPHELWLSPTTMVRTQWLPEDASMSMISLHFACKAMWHKELKSA